MKASERLEKINDLSEELEDDMEEVRLNYNQVKNHLMSTIDGLEDIGVNYPDLSNTVSDIEQAKENELNNLIDNYIVKVGEI